ncbi:hypothetical protein M601_009095 [Cellulophaga baltica 4]|nr:hypothetical protein M601_009095 [Cellulophaga baltica 4]
MGPTLLDLKLDRASEMGLGVGVPIILLLCYEFYLTVNFSENKQYEAYMAQVAGKLVIVDDTSSTDNKRGTRVIGIGIAVTGLIILILSFIAATGAMMVGIMGAVVASLGSIITYKSFK